MPAPNRSHALDHIVVVLFENRSLENVLGHLYRPEDDKNFDGVIGKDLSNPIPEWAEHGADRKVVPYTVATDMDSPNPDSGEEYYHTNTQLYNTLDEHNRFKIGEAVAAPWNARHWGRYRRWMGLSPTTSRPSPARSVASPATTSTPTS
jgi:phospholipase C